MSNQYDFPDQGIYSVIKGYLNSLSDLEGKVVVDVPCGDGRTTYVLKQKGATVLPFDLFPEFFKLGTEAKFADLSERLPLEDNSCDVIICQEGIEHLPDQLFALKEFNRVLRPSGRLILTAPNASNLVGRLATFTFESELLRQSPDSAEEVAWRFERTDDAEGQAPVRHYYGHLFLIGIQRLRTLLRLAKFGDIEFLHTHKSKSSIFLVPFMYPLIWLFSMRSYLKAQRRYAGNDSMLQEKSAQLDANLSLMLLTNKHLFLVCKKM